MAGELTLADLSRSLIHSFNKLEGKFSALESRFGKTEDKLDNISVLQAKLESIIEDLRDHEKRIRAIERYVWVAVGISATGAASGLAALVNAINP